jgi:voltage-gated potassium channel
MLIEGWSPIDAIFMTMITISTVGYGEVNPLGHAGRVFSIFLIVGGVSGGLFVLTAFIEYIVEGKLGLARRRRQMKAKKDHFILCGYGRVGKEIAHTFSEEGIPFVIVDNRQDNFAMAKEHGYLCLQGDATSDKVLIEAGIERARGLVAAMGSDAENIYITLSARGLRPDLFIEARASNKEAETKLKRAGADRVVSPSSIGARRMAMLALRPAVADFIDSVTYRRGQELLMENIIVDSKSPLAGLTIEAIHKRVKTVTLAISKKSGKLLANPPNDATIEVGDRLIIMGTPKELTALECFCEGGQPR